MNKLIFTLICLFTFFNLNAQMDSISVSAVFGNPIAEPEDSMVTLNQIIVSTYIGDTTNFGNIFIEVSDTSGMTVIARMDWDKDAIISNGLFSNGVITTNITFLPIDWFFYKITIVVADDTGALMAPISLVINQ